MADAEGLDTKVGAQLAGESPESSLWFAWKRAHELVRAAAARAGRAQAAAEAQAVGAVWQA